VLSVLTAGTLVYKNRYFNKRHEYKIMVPVNRPKTAADTENSMAPVIDTDRKVSHGLIKKDSTVKH
jgi:hypothetical protein